MINLSSLHGSVLIGKRQFQFSEQQLGVKKLVKSFKAI